MRLGSVLAVVAFVFAGAVVGAMSSAARAETAGVKRAAVPPQLATSFLYTSSGIFEQFRKGPPIVIRPQAEVEPTRHVEAKDWKSPYCTDWSDGCTRCVRRRARDAPVCVPHNPDFTDVECSRRGITCIADDPRATKQLCHGLHFFQVLRKPSVGRVRRNYHYAPWELALDDRGIWEKNGGMSHQESLDHTRGGQPWNWIPVDDIVPGVIAERLRIQAHEDLPDLPTIYCEGWEKTARERGWIK
ncbi:MAG: hypothetical protein HXX10_17905 [Rhodoplanes sp.]|uniref:hypothetical protein n=1 Tax=Rhodoplanes sp. TaxID=1968906 RepID=UPI001831C754|nr:hypothetical protein [Rhodoplanes sp.]NVO15911.1 hypothetical protein [Rhodoplanes sp.]